MKISTTNLNLNIRSIIFGAIILAIPIIMAPTLAGAAVFSGPVQELAGSAAVVSPDYAFVHSEFTTPVYGEFLADFGNGRVIRHVSPVHLWHLFRVTPTAAFQAGGFRMSPRAYHPDAWSVVIARPSQDLEPGRLSN